MLPHVKFLEQVMQQLREAGFIESERGKHGGYRLARPAAEITIGGVVRLIDGPLAPIGCVSQTAYAPCNCPDEAHCGLRMLMLDVRNAIAAILDRYTLGDVVEVTTRKMASSGPGPSFQHPGFFHPPRWNKISPPAHSLLPAPPRASSTNSWETTPYERSCHSTIASRPTARMAAGRAAKVESLRYRVVQLVVHDGRVTQIERTEKNPPRAQPHRVGHLILSAHRHPRRCHYPSPTSTDPTTGSSHEDDTLQIP